MNSVDPNLELTLELARGAGEPSAADRRRNFEALSSRLGEPLAGNALSFGTRPLPAKASVLARTLRPRLGLGHLVAVAAVAGGLGFWLGSAAPFRGEPRAAELTEAAAPSAMTSAAEAARSQRTDEATEPPGTARETSSAKPFEPSTAGQGTEKTSRAAPPASRRGALVRPHPRARPQASSASDPGVRFLEAVRLLERAQRSIDTGEAAFGMTLLDELDARFPRALLDEERQAARVLGWCSLGQTEQARAGALALSKRNPTSIYRARLERTCTHGELSEP
jgi:hypothetical protein